MVCPKCGSTNVNVQAVGVTKTKKKGMFVLAVYRLVAGNVPVVGFDTAHVDCKIIWP